MPEPVDDARFDSAGLNRVIADALRFKQRLRIGEDAYIMLRAKNRLGEVWDAVGAGTAGASLAASPVVAQALVAPTATASILGWLGLAAPAATPIGWVVAAAMVTAGGYYGVSRWWRGAKGGLVEEIPRYINSPVDLLAASLLDLMGPLIVRIAAIDGHIAPQERDLIKTHFVADWGYDPAFIARAIDLFEAEADSFRVKDFVKRLADFQSANPDCNAPAMQAELMLFLRELVSVDGVIDEREEHALDAISATLADANALSLASAASSMQAIGQGAGALAGQAASVAAQAATAVGSAARDLIDRARGTAEQPAAKPEGVDSRAP